MLEPVAVTGIGCRFPGGANSPGAFWDLLCAGTDAISEIPADRWSVAAYYDPTPGHPSKSISKWGGFVDSISEFDSSFFSISDREADAMDPQQRLLLETTWEALEDSGEKIDTLRGSSTGVFVGISTTDYSGMQLDDQGNGQGDMYSVTGGAISIAANRISYFFDLRGPSLSVDTACSSALTACHLACQSLWRNDCTKAIVAGANALLNHNTFVAFSRMSMLSPEGRCKAFGAGANGFVRAEGAGAVLLKPLSAAIAAGDRIYAVIRSTAANQDGHTRGITLPSQTAQEGLIRSACRLAGISPGDICYVEAHGTGTAMGDPIEAAALGCALGKDRATACPIGSVKTNIGHLEAASGIASLIKVALALRHKQIPPSLHSSTPNPDIDFDGLKLRVVQRLEDLSRVTRPLLAGISSFGFGGANAHVILEDGPTAQKVPVSRSAAPVFPHLVLPLSAHSPDALHTAALKYRLLLQSGLDATSICGAAATRRSMFAHRLCIHAETRDELIANLGKFTAGTESPAVIRGEAVSEEALTFVFSGHGPQWWGMGRELFTDQPIFRAKIEECDEILRTFSAWSLLEELSRNQATSRLHDTAIAQPAIFSLQVALAALWSSWGVVPECVVGHSLGEVAAAHVAGVLTLREAARVIFHRGRCMNAAPTTGRMLAARLTEEQAGEIVAEFPGVCVAAVNAPASVTLSGDEAPLRNIAARLEARGIFHRFLQVNYAFHSEQMDGVRTDLLTALGKIDTAPAKLTIVSTVAGLPMAGHEFDADYWWRNVRFAVRFNDAIGEVCSRGRRLFLELGAHPALGASITETLAARHVDGKACFSLRRQEPEQLTMIANLCRMWVAGARIDWTRVFRGDYREVPLPTYPWQHQNHWRESKMMRDARLATPLHPFLTRKLDTPLRSWITTLDLNDMPWLKDHRIQDRVLFPGAGYIEAALAIAADLFKTPALEIADMEFKRVLCLAETRGSVQLQSEVSEPGKTVRFSSRVGGEGEWAANATAAIRGDGSNPRRRIDLNKLKRKLRRTLRKDQIYAACERRGLSYGPMFRAVEALWRSNSEALGRVVLPGPLSTEAHRFNFHPVLLDGCLQAMLFAAPDAAETRTFLPVRMDRVTLWTRPGNSVFCHARLLESNGQSLSWDFEVCDESGLVLAAVEGCCVQALRGSGAARNRQSLNWLYETRWIEAPAAQVPIEKHPKIPSEWLVLCDSTGVGEQLARILRRKGGVAKVIPAAQCLGYVEEGKLQLADSFETTLCNALRGSGRKLAGIVHLWNIDAEKDSQSEARLLQRAEVRGCHSILRLVQTLVQEGIRAPLWIVTRGAQKVRAGDGVAVMQAPAIGMARTIATEIHLFRCRAVDLQHENTPQAADRLWLETAAPDHETEVAWREGKRYANRLMRTELGALAARQSPRSAYRLDPPSNGVIEELAFHLAPRRVPRAGEVEIEICAAALNFRDVLKTLGIYPVQSERDLLLGDECSGRVASVGRGVTRFKPGDAVIAAGAGCFGSHITVPESHLVAKPEQLSFADAAGIQVAFMTAWYALHSLGEIHSGHRVLIHSAAGGVGLAAVQIAQLSGAEIFATVGTREKRKHLRAMGVRHIMDSRSTDFAGKIRGITRGLGVDIVLNSLAGDAIMQGISVLAPGGKFLEIGKRDVYANTAVGLRALRNNISIHVIDMGRIMSENPGMVRHLLSTLMGLFRQGKLRALPHQDFSMADAAAAFRQMSLAKHIGKIVLTTDKTPPPVKPVFDSFAVPVRADATYLITGGLGGFGLALATWLVQKGARSLVLAGRKGAQSQESKNAVAELEQHGVNVQVVKCDVSDAAEVASLFVALGQGKSRLRGVFHCAMVLDDGALVQLTPNRFSRVMTSKAHGAWNLHCASRGLKLDHFVLFSSIAALIGNAGQASYVAANCFLDALALHRRHLGLAALSVNWGPIGDVGILARNPRTADHLAELGVHAMSPDSATEMLGLLMQTGTAQIGFMHVDWQRLLRVLAGDSSLPRFGAVASPAAEHEPTDSGDIRSLLLLLSPQERQTQAEAIVARTSAAVLRAIPGSLGMNRPLHELGLDSLASLELINRLEDQFAISLPSTAIGAASTVASLAAAILRIVSPAPLGEIALQSAAAPAERDTPNGGGEAVDLSKQVVILRGSGEDTPLFLIHPAGGGIDVYTGLVTHLRAGFPVYAIQSRVLAGHAEEWQSLAEMAESYASIVGSLQPEGDLRIAGFSAGGLFAWVTARALERQSRNVSFTGLIETPLAVLDADHPRERLLRSLIVEILEDRIGERAAARLSNDGRFDASVTRLTQSVEQASDPGRQLDLVMNWLAHQGLVRELTRTMNGQLGLKMLVSLIIRHTYLIDVRKLDGLDGPVWVLRAAASWLTGGPVPDAVLARITRGPVSEDSVGGRHFEAMRTPHVESLASKLSEALAQSRKMAKACHVMPSAGI